MSVQIFKDKEHQQLFDKQGFIILPFLTELEIQELSNYFDQTHPVIENDVFFSSRRRRTRCSGDSWGRRCV